MEHNYCVFIGRFQPLHASHLQVIKQGLETAKELIIIIGSAKSARTIKNPWTFQERVDMIKFCLNEREKERVHFIPARDYHYSDSMWLTEIQQKVNAITDGDSNVCMIGSYKDSSSYYFRYFPQWEFVPAKTNKSLNATDIRVKMFDDEDYNLLADTDLPSQVGAWLNTWVVHFTEVYENLREEYQYIKDYKNKWSTVPFPVTFNTVDALVIKSGHVLVVRRKHNPGKGLLALPGGFLRQDERLEAGAIRELKEETGIKVHAAELKKHIIDSKTFDYPARSLRGRTITTVFCIKLPDEGELPEVKGMDDAEKAVWIPLADALANESEFFEDHGHIIRYFINRF